MTNAQIIEIPLSKKKMLATFFGATLFVILGAWFLINPPQISNRVFGNPTLIFATGLTSVIFFGAIAIIIIRKMMDKRPGLIINKEGIIDNSSGVSAGLIPWNDIENITVTKVMSQRFLMIHVRNPQDYLSKVTNPIKRNTMALNYKSYGSPISISANALEIDFDNFYNLLTDKINENR